MRRTGLGNAFGLARSQMKSVQFDTALLKLLRPMPPEKPNTSLTPMLYDSLRYDTDVILLRCGCGYSQRPAVL
jgi:hypothetical protein